MAVDGALQHGHGRIGDSTDMEAAARQLARRAMHGRRLMRHQRQRSSPACTMRGEKLLVCRCALVPSQWDELIACSSKCIQPSEDSEMACHHKPF